jgi:integrase
MRITIGDWMDRARIEADCAWRRITPHDLRSTCKSWLSALRIEYEIRQRYLDHALTGMGKIYDKSDLTEYCRDAEVKWLAFMTDREQGKETAKVLKLEQLAA